MMPGLHKEARPLNDDKIRELECDLRNLQGNILRGHGRDHAFHIFLKFNENNIPEVKKWIREIAGYVTSAHKQREEAAEYRQNKISGKLFHSFLLSAEGYKVLGYDNEKIPGDVAFREGIENRKSELDYQEDRIDWEEKYLGGIHAMLMLADDENNKNILEYEKERYIKQLAMRHLIKDDGFFVEEGRIIRDEKDKTISREPFGFRDNISQPLFFENDMQGDMSKWNPGAGPNLVLVEDPNTPRDDIEAHGSYLVFLKLEQDVDSFDATRQNEQMHIFGRDPEGRPFLPKESVDPGSRKETTGEAPFNNFTYSIVDPPQDDDAPPPETIPPLTSHIRRMNPRGEFSRSKRRPSWYDRRYRIARRSIPYGMPRNEYSETGVGLLFMCYQKDISVQFEFLQQLANDNSYLGYKNVGSDNLMRFVKLKGGEYFFAPSIPFLKTLA
jgi:Dyp-type peroxidase family